MSHPIQFYRKIYCIAFIISCLNRIWPFPPWSFSYVSIPRCHPFIRNDCKFHYFMEVLVMRLARVDGNLRTTKVLSCQGRNCKFSFLPLSPWVLQLNGKTANLDFILIIVFPSFTFTWKELLAICTQVPLVMGSHPGERQVMSLDSASRACMGSASVRGQA